MSDKQCKQIYFSRCDIFPLIRGKKVVVMKVVTVGDVYFDSSSASSPGFIRCQLTCVHPVPAHLGSSGASSPVFIRCQLTCVHPVPAHLGSSVASSPGLLWKKGHKTTLFVAYLLQSDKYPVVFVRP